MSFDGVGGAGRGRRKGPGSEGKWRKKGRRNKRKNTTNKLHASQFNVITSFGKVQDNRSYIVIMITCQIEVDFRM